ncbi:MAG: PorT family protein [Saprospiraceae bacterium]|nr:PorT family protein [Candidatus Vicinibacter affinis]MBP6173331.1 PorT family protein [Saprospiraceae bacterium]MBK6823799.1 PorT family protein [Candidatus Vicinibacter affinis]MBK7304454.1 PorT family protein [Candidatus Vicinibacter affinis]MBK7800371.1 PorT family protein [Candidatus Vicinibacter affinis]
MKKNILFYTILILYFLLNKNILFAQSNTVLLNFSLNNYKLDRFNLPEENAAIISGIGFNLGFAYEKPICKKSSILLGFEFSKRKYDYSIGPRNNNFNDNYISLPLSFNYYILKFIAFQAGMQFDHLLFKQKLIYYKDAPNDQVSGYTKYDIGLNTGIRIQWYNFEINGSFNYGLRNIYCLNFLDPITGEELVDSAKSHMFKFGVSYLFK